MKLKILIPALVILAAAIQLHAESVFINDGSIIQGSIVSDTTDTITIYTTQKKTIEIQRSRIMRILYTELYMGKIFVNLIDGSVLQVYMVDENRDTFTFRKDLYKPEEMVVKREDVLFTTRTNPVGLKGEAKKDSISIDWKPPYTAVKHYRVYIKSNGQYKLYSEPSGKNETLNGLKSNTEYKIRVTAMGKDGVESTPSNEIIIKTLNVPPDPPEKMKVTRKLNKDGKTMSAILSWDNSADIDGKIKSYKIYQKDKTDPYTTAKPEYEVKNLDAETVYFFNITAIDNDGGESDQSRRVSTYDYKGYNIAIKPDYIIPMGKFSNVHEFGLGALLQVTLENVFIDDLSFGAETGYWQFQGVETDSTTVSASFMMPLVATASYRLNLFDEFYAVPELALGVSFNYMNYESEVDLYTGYAIAREKKTVWSVEPLVLAGLSFEFNISHRVYATAGCDFGMLVELSGIIPFVTVSAGAGIKF